MTETTPEEARQEAQALARIAEIKQQLAKDLLILGHHYQSDQVIQFADYQGDSLELSRIAATVKDARYIVFCGVDFMAETAAMLCDPLQTVCLPAESAVCPMARMADVEDVATAWDQLVALWGSEPTPVTYQNSYANLKAWCGQREGAVCTSSNAQAIMRWGLEQRGRILFFPDEHLGTNSALALGIPREKIAVWNPFDIESSVLAARDATIVVWKGFCNVHVFFTVDHVREVRHAYPDIKVVVHPECTSAVVAASDMNGSTSYIIRVVEEAAPGSSFAIGTEWNLVNRLAERHTDKIVVPLARSMCRTMARITTLNLWQTLESVVSGQPTGVVRIPAETTRWANKALEKMLSIK